MGFASVREISAWARGSRLWPLYACFDQTAEETNNGRQRQIEEFHAKIVGQMFSEYGIFRNEERSEIRDAWCALPGQIAITLSTRGNAAT